VRRVLDALHPTIEAGKKQIAIELPKTPVVLYVDPMRVEQVIGNLVHNAVKFTPHGGHIWLTATVERENRLHITVRDDGDGIAPDVLPHVFDLFTQGSTSFERAQGGLGIGLTLVRGLIELHGGTIAVQSDGPGTGSQFIMTLPLQKGPAPAAQPASQLGRASSEARRVLIVDDNVDAANALAALLRQERHTVEVSHSGAAALEVARTFQPQVALVDLGMPGMNGFEVAERLRAALDGVVLVAVSGYSGDESRRRARAAGFDEYVVKPFDPRAFEELSRRAR
jgi:CheY-like chemotaxis protein